MGREKRIILAIAVIVLAVGACTVKAKAETPRPAPASYDPKGYLHDGSWFSGVYRSPVTDNCYEVIWHKSGLELAGTFALNGCPPDVLY